MAPMNASNKHRSLYVNNLNNLDFSGYGMLISQFIGAYSLYFISFYLIIAYFYFTSKNENILLMTILLTSLIMSGFHFFGHYYFTLLIIRLVILNGKK